MIAAGRPAVERAYKLTDWSACANGETCFRVESPSRAMVGTNAGTFIGRYSEYPGGGLGSTCWVFMVEDFKGWHYLNAACVQNPGSSPGAVDRVVVTGCANVRQSHRLSAKVLGCLRNGTVVNLDTAPVYQDKHVWWHLAGHGWMAHDFLVMPRELRFTDYPIPSAKSAPGGITTGPDGNIWFTEYGRGNVAKVTTSGVLTEYATPTPNSGPVDITVGPDGNLWFTENTANRVAKVTTSGSFTEYPVPTRTNGSGAYGIVTGPDGNLWFTETDTNKVAKVSTSGVFTEYLVPTDSSGPLDIAVGPDRNLWFIERDANQVAKVTRKGVITEYQIPSADSSMQGIVAGRDGKMWITEGSVNKVAKVTTSGVVTEYSIPTDNSGSQGIGVGPDGSVWFVENYTRKLAHVTSSGVFSEYPIPTMPSSWGNGPYCWGGCASLITGPDGNIWLTEAFANNVTRVQ
jgi:streptogramin lyase